MDEQESVDPNYKKGFEIGYWLKRGNNPHLNDIIHNNNNGGSYHSGLTAGSKEAVKEQFRERMDRTKAGKEADKDKGFDIG